MPVFAFFAIFLVLTLLSGCTISLNVIHTQGSASDLVDETQSPTTSTSATIPLLK